jgi:nitrite reductase/ring-hydroxylating ferredoxin subunit
MELSRGLLCRTAVPSDIGVYEQDGALRALRCPRHGFEFDVRTGRHLYDESSRLRVATYPAWVADGAVWVDA